MKENEPEAKLPRNDILHMTVTKPWRISTIDDNDNMHHFERTNHNQATTPATVNTPASHIHTPWFCYAVKCWTNSSKHQLAIGQLRKINVCSKIHCSHDGLEVCQIDLRNLANPHLCARHHSIKLGKNTSGSVLVSCLNKKVENHQLSFSYTISFR